jgi:alpha-N-arabinofuranosidase
MRKKNGHPEPFNVKFWSVGNERSGKAYIHRVRDGAKAMKQLDPSILVTCSGTHGGGRVDPYLFESAGKYLDYISVHNYWLPRGNSLPRYDYMTAITKSEMPEAYIKVAGESLGNAGMRDRIKIAFDEWNLRAWQHPGFPRNKVADYNDPKIIDLVQRRVKGNDFAEQYTMADALFSASFFNACLRHCENVTMANIAPIVNTRGPLFVHPKGIVKRTHFHTMVMYANLLKECVGSLKVISGELTDGKRSVVIIDAIATVDKAGKNWSIALVNRHPSNSIDCIVRIKDRVPDGEYDATVLTGESTDSYNDIEHPDRVSPKKTKLTFKNGVVNLPPHSLTIVNVQVQ